MLVNKTGLIASACGGVAKVYCQIQIVYDNIDDAEGFFKTLGQQTLFDKDIMD